MRSDPIDLSGTGRVLIKMRLDMGQILSIPFVLLGIGFIVYGVMKFKSNVD